jgi:hypothetical protein
MTFSSLGIKYAPRISEALSAVWTRYPTSVFRLQKTLVAVGTYRMATFRNEHFLCCHGHQTYGAAQRLSWGLARHRLVSCGRPALGSRLSRRNGRREIWSGPRRRRKRRKRRFREAFDWVQDRIVVVVDKTAHHVRLAELVLWRRCLGLFRRTRSCSGRSFIVLTREKGFYGQDESHLVLAQKFVRLGPREFRYGAERVQIGILDRVCSGGFELRRRPGQASPAIIK